MMRKVGLGVAALAVIVLGTQAAWATCSGTLVDLTSNNLGIPGSDYTLQLCVETSGDTTIVTLYAADPGSTGLGGFHFTNQFDWNGNAVFADSVPNGWDLVHNNGAADGFGKFDNEVNFPGNQSGLGTQWTFDTSESAPPTEFALHVGWENCTGWFTNISETHGSTPAGCEPIPEPGTLTLLGTGLLGLAGVIRRRMGG